MNNHQPCAGLNDYYGSWEKVSHKAPYGWFFDYYQLKVVDSKTGKLTGHTYFDRVNKLDKIFDWICQKVKLK